MINLLRQTIETLTAHKLKSLLAMIAIAWGVTSVVVLLALGQGFYQHQSASLAFLLNNSQIAYSGQASKTWQGLPARRPVTLTDENLKPLSRSPLIKAISLVYINNSVAVNNSKGHFIGSTAAGIDPHYFDYSALHLKPGSRNISPQDIANRARVAVIGWQLAQSSQLKVGDQIKVNHIPFTIVGIIDGDNVSISFGDGTRVDIPSSTFKDIWDVNPGYMIVKPQSGVSGVNLRRYLTNFFSKTLHFDPSDQNAVFLPDMSSGGKMITALLRGVQIFLGASGTMTLAVGALGVANIMFLSVTERTREIGVRLAIGATRRAILAQFVTEGILLVTFGALIGIGFAYALVFLLDAIALPSWLGSPSITSSSLWVTSMVTFVLAILSAWFPARRAAALQPVIALGARV